MAALKVRVFGLCGAGLLACAAVLPAGAARAVTAPDPAVQAHQVAQRILALTAEYARRSALVSAAAARLAQAYRGVAAADADADRAHEALAELRDRRAEQVRELYAAGPGADGRLTLLTADSPDEALWRLSVGAHIGLQVLRGTDRRTRQAQQALATSQSQVSDQVAAGEHLVQTLTAVREAQSAAESALAQARAELARLNGLARRQQAAQQAAARLAAAEVAAAGARLRDPVEALDIPVRYTRYYRAAAGTCPGLAWTLLAAVGQIESGHGRDNGPSSAGAIGPMQFLPATFAVYAVDGDGDGVTDPWNPADAIFTAAHYLCAGGAGRGPAGVRRALFAYNHAQWYVDLVLSAQAAILARTKRQ